ncbi:hypothetical protein NUACC26_093780 [Scytonema sp. NUACC26]
MSTRQIITLLTSQAPNRGSAGIGVRRYIKGFFLQSSRDALLYYED